MNKVIKDINNKMKLSARFLAQFFAAASVVW